MAKKITPETDTKVDEAAKQLQELNETIAKVKAAQTKFATYTQEQVDDIFRAAAIAANEARIPLAKMAVAETGMGVIEDKVIKNHFASEYVYNKYKTEKTCDMIEYDEGFGIMKLAEPVGLIAGIVPTTNPTSTAIFKSLLALKTRNGIIFSPHPRAKKSTIAAAKVVLDAAVAAGAPEGIIGWIPEPTVALSQHLMSHPMISLILATGGPGMVKAAYSSGIPALGVGAGNTPAVMDESCDILMAVSSVLQSKTFDNGMICASEQSVIAIESIYDAVKAEFVRRGAYILNKTEGAKVAKTIVVDGKLNAKIVGQSAAKIAEMAGIKVDPETKVLIGETDGVGRDYPFSCEKLSPVLALYKAKDFNAALDRAQQLLEFGGMGHTSVLYTNPRNRDRIDEFGGDYQRRFGNEYKWVSIKIIYNKRLALNEVIMCFREIDMEKRKQLQQHALLENALNSAKQTVEKKNLFFSNVSHDMRTPLNAITGLSELAKKNVEDPEKVRDYIEKIENAGKQLLTLVNDILDMSRLEHGEKGTLDYAPMNLKTCIEDSASLFLQQARREKKVLTITSELENPMVYCDQFRLNQILNNLLSNAFKYSTEGALIHVDLIQIDAKNNHGKYQLQVKDTGIGMTQEFLEKIFEPFARETTFAPTKITGTGLGMPIVKSLVQQMSGEIAIQSTLGEGTCITIILPLQIAESETSQESDSAADTPAVQPSGLSGIKILIAEDNEINMEIAAEYLTMMGAEVIQAWNGREAVDIFRTLEPGSVDVILMDMQMPEMDGCTASRTIRALDRKDAAQVPIIAVTANAFSEDIARTKEAGMNAHIAKPIDFGVLIQVLNHVLAEQK